MENDNKELVHFVMALAKRQEQIREYLGQVANFIHGVSQILLEIQVMLHDMPEYDPEKYPQMEAIYEEINRVYEEAMKNKKEK